MINKTGRPEHLTPSGSDGGDVLNTLRRIERLLGAGNVIAARAPSQTGYAVGRGLGTATSRAVGSAMHSTARPIA